MAVRLNFIVEGQTEEAFVKQILKPHLAELSVWANARCVMTSRKGVSSIEAVFRSMRKSKMTLMHG